MAQRFRTTLRKRKPPKTPRPGQFVSNYRDDYEIPTGRLALDPDKLATYLKRADAGNARAQQEMFDGIEEDPHVMSVLSKRKRRVLSRTMQITPADDTPAAQEAAELCQRVVLGESGDTGIVGWRGAVWDMLSAIGRGYSLMQIIWQWDGEVWRPEQLSHYPQRFTVLGDQRLRHAVRAKDEVSADRIYVLTDEQPVQGEPIDEMPFQWLVHKHKARSGPLVSAALLRAVAWWYLFKHFSVRDWAIFCERYGMPIRLGKYPVNANDEHKDALWDAVITLGKDGGAILPDGATLELVELAARGELPYDKLAAFCNAEISKVVQGGTLTTEAGNIGSQALGQVHQDQEESLADHDASDLEETIRTQLLTPICLINLGEHAMVPKFTFLLDEDEDQEARARRDKIIIKDVGIAVRVADLREKYGYTEPEEGDEVIGGTGSYLFGIEEPPAPPPSPFGQQSDEDEDEAGEADEGDSGSGDGDGATGDASGEGEDEDDRSSRARAAASHSPHALADDGKKKSASWAR